MKKINLENYDVNVRNKEEIEKIPYKVKESLSNILFHPANKLSGRDLLLAHKLGNKIEECKEDHILLEEVDYLKLKKSVENIEGFTKNDVEFVKRVLEAEDVEVKEKESKK